MCWHFGALRTWRSLDLSLPHTPPLLLFMCLWQHQSLSCPLQSRGPVSNVSCHSESEPARFSPLCILPATYSGDVLFYYSNTGQHFRISSQKSNNAFLVLQIHLSSHMTACVTMSHEYIVPMSDQTRDITLYPSSSDDDRIGGSFKPLGGFPNSSSTSLKPQMCFLAPCFVWNEGVGEDCSPEKAFTESPEIPLDILKNLTVKMLTFGVWAVGQGVRDPVGGSMDSLLVPLIRLFYTLLVMGEFEDKDLGEVLRLMEPEVFSMTPDSHNKKGDARREDEEERKWDKENKNDTAKQGLLQMKLPEAVKLEVKTMDMLLYRTFYQF